MTKNAPETALTIEVDGHRVSARVGESVAAALLACGERTLRVTRRRGEARGLFCVMGACYDCLVTIDGVPAQRACMRRVEFGMRIDRRGMKE